MSSEPPDRDVVGVRLHSRSPVTAQWLRRAVVPAFRRLRHEEAADVVYLRPGWLHGPHVDLIARPSGQSGPLPWEDLAAHLDAGEADPATVLDEEAYLAQARELGRLERVPPPYLPMRAHGTIERITSADLPVWPAPLGALRELVLTRLCDALTGTAERIGASPGDATRRVAEVFVALAGAHRWGPAFGVFSLRSHAEAFFAWAAASTDPRPAFARRLRGDAPLFREIVEQALAGQPGPHGVAWRDGLSYGNGVLEAAVASGTLDSAFVDAVAGEYDSATMGPPGARPGATAGPSDFHQRVDAAGVTADPPAWFAGFRVLINLVYQQLPLLGVPPLHRYYFCYAVAETVDHVLGESWQDRLGRVERRTAEAVR